MTVYFLGNRLAHAHQHRRPYDRVKPHNLLANNVVGWPVLIVVVITIIHISHGSRIVKQCINPDVYHMTRVKVHRNPPLKAGS